MKAKAIFNNTAEPGNMTRYLAACIVLMKHAPAYHVVLVNTKVIWTRQVPRAGTCGGYIYLNPDFFMGLPNDSQRAFLLAHEVGHIVLRHPLRGLFYAKRGFHTIVSGIKVPWNHDCWNIAADKVINADLIAHGLEPIPEGLYDSNVTRDHLVDEVYLDEVRNLPEPPPPPPEGEDGEESESGQSGESGESGESGDESESDDESGEGQDGESGEDGEESDADDTSSGNEGDGEESESDESGDGESGDGEGEDGESEGDDSGEGESDEESDSEGEGESDEDGDAGDGDATGAGDGTDADDPESGDESESEPQPSNHGGIDDHFEPQYEGSEEEQAEAAEQDRKEVQRMVDDALDILADAQERGEHVPACGKGFGSSGYRHSGEGLASDTNWRQELSDLVTRKGSEGDVCWSRIHRRRYCTLGTITPTRKGTFDRMAIIIDISGSVDRRALHQFLLEVAAMIDLLTPSSGCLVLFTNTEVHSEYEVFSGAELLELNVPNCGGTTMSAGLHYMEQHGLTADVTLCFTDGELWDSGDMQYLADNDVVMVLDSHPRSWVASEIDETGIRTIVANDVDLAA